MTPCLPILSLQFWRQQFALILNYLTDPRKAVDFSVCSDFYLLVWSGNFHTHFMLNQKLEVAISDFKDFKYLGIIIDYVQ